MLIPIVEKIFGFIAKSVNQIINKPIQLIKINNVTITNPSAEQYVNILKEFCNSNLPGSEIKKSRYYPVPLSFEEEMKVQIQMRLNKGWIEPPKSIDGFKKIDAYNIELNYIQGHINHGANSLSIMYSSTVTNVNVINTRNNLIIKT
ncbi:hypothetical protein ACTA71_007897 [Dictyostelium dimigraforme]